MTFNEQLRKRTKELALSTIRWYQKTPKQGEEVRIMGRQLLRSITSVAANFRAATVGRSTREYYSKLCIVVEEADESVFWMECFLELDIKNKASLQPIYQECKEVMYIMSKARKNAKAKLKN